MAVNGAGQGNGDAAVDVVQKEKDEDAEKRRLQSVMHFGPSGLALDEDGETLRDDVDLEDLNHITRFVIGTVFKRFVLLCVFVSSVCLLLERPSQGDTESLVLGFSFLCVNIIFLIEVILKVAVFGFRGYCRSTFNRLDFLLILLWIIDMLFEYLHPEGCIPSYLHTCILLGASSDCLPVILGACTIIATISVSRSMVHCTRIEIISVSCSLVRELAW